VARLAELPDNRWIQCGFDMRWAIFCWPLALIKHHHSHVPIMNPAPYRAPAQDAELF